tara:strand:- start:249 stop:419 length:171 start_codon:yes stop_codon:yes gene_type:complete
MTNAFSKMMFIDSFNSSLKDEFCKRRKIEVGDVKNGEKVRNFRKQEEYGPKKFIKP